ncbi:hypothetical protein SBOR_4518 [Sclerotinia borealis F-4128]|uniref:Chromo domain-containing protein n=1 Tax=Sclerotinia borealis (strain F-4128) TaxID=1432307 RepID=W9CEB4_SCLBF|nr:hypothetical protein SBOR_4518 [Sclerotinia borealis F-4128]
MARLNTRNPRFKAPVPNMSAAQQSPVEQRKVNRVDKNGAVVKGGKGVSGKGSGRRSFGTGGRVDAEGSSRAPVAQMFAGGGDGEDESENGDEDKDEEYDEVMSGDNTRKGNMEKEDGEDEDDEAGVRNELQREDALPNLPNKQRTPKSSSLLNKSRLRDNNKGQEDTPRRRGRPKKIGGLTTPAGEAEVVMSSKQYPKSSSRSKDLAEKIVPAAEQIEDEEENEEDEGDGDEPEAETETETLKDSTTKEFFEVLAVQGSRKDGADNEQLLVEWKNFPREKDWTWEPIEKLRKSCPNFVKEWEDSSQNEDTGMHEVESIMGKRKGPGGRFQYHIKWVGWGKKYNTWEPAEKLKIDVPYIVEEFEEAQSQNERAGMDLEQPVAKRRSAGRPRK